MQNNANSHSEANCVTLHMIEQRLRMVEAAFPRTDVGTLDVDGHRDYHVEKKRTDTLIREYQEGITKRVILAAVSMALTALGAGFADWSHLAALVQSWLSPYTQVWGFP